MKKWQKRLVQLLFIVLFLVVLNHFTGSRKYVETACKESVTIQRYPMLKFGCAVMVLDWKEADKAFSEINFYIIDDF